MHRHGYKGRKFGRETDQRTALTRGLMRSLFKNKSISTTLAKAKEIRRPAEKLITIAKKGDLTSRRLVIARLNDQLIGNELVDVIAPQLKRNSGYLRIERNGFRRGDNAEMATISFVDEIKEKEAKSEPKAKVEPKAKPAKKETK
ncbi:50S ribosomal protein L17 [Candidatus Saccharibacteria bacterium]|nr:50S ribosomal protein L17 [Candidatus Saccharibacteria bacterium]